MKVYYDKQNRRLVFISENATPAFWEKHWEDLNLQQMIEIGKNNRFVLNILKKYVPDKKGWILEGGCGIAQIVYCMHIHGYNVIGLDFAEKTMKKVKRVVPRLNIITGDLRSLPFRDNSLTGYWSLGVIEHFYDGYGEIIKEAKRVLANGGYFFLSFPYMSPLRKLKTRVSMYKEFEEIEKNGKGDFGFYQFALDPEMVIRDLEAVGFKLLEKKAVDGVKGLKDEVIFLKPFLQKLYNYRGKSLVIRGFRYCLDKILANFGFGHIMFLVFIKESEDKKCKKDQK